MMQQSGRITEHPVLGQREPREPVTVYFNGRAIPAFEGDTIAAALVASGVRVFRNSHKRGEPRGIFCANGHCTDCAMQVEGVENTKICITFVREGMQITGE